MAREVVRVHDVLCVYVYVCVCVCVRVYVCMYACMYVCVCGAVNDIPAEGMMSGKLVHIFERVVLWWC